jgi:glycosyltransferase involved in cell wall biosynthesis
MTMSDQVTDLIIYIPTYNRLIKLDNCLKIISSEIKGHESRVKVFVSNNGSTDGTLELLKNFNQEWLIFQSHENNQEAFLNIIGVYDLPIKGKFVWVIGDDDYLMPGSIAELLLHIENCPDIDFIFCNTTAFPGDQSDEIMHKYLQSGEIGSGNLKSNIFKEVEKVEFEKLIDPRIADTLLGELMVLCFRQEKFHFSYKSARDINEELQIVWREPNCSLNDQGRFRQPHNFGLLENIKSDTPSLYLPNPKTFNFWGSATEWLGDYDYVFPVIILYLIKEYKNKGIINYEKYIELLNYYFQIMNQSFYRQFKGESNAKNFPNVLKAEFFDALFELHLMKKK